ncbi:MAG TPA: DNA-directed RNA polymerase subunit omega [Acidobacteriaceae bacterium]|jgi:DNA-directed RNA polymerase subunit omega|nr:DNA-directed RNA polymerase subunit omega [Acidobacteriaceae bacterium]
MRIENTFDNRYNLVKVAARRARQLQSGALPMVDTQSTKACRVAQDEIRAGHVKYVFTEPVPRPDFDLK